MWCRAGRGRVGSEDAYVQNAEKMLCLAGTVSLKCSAVLPVAGAWCFRLQAGHRASTGYYTAALCL